MAAAVSLISVPLFGYLSDLIGRRLMYGIGIVCIALYAFPYFGLLNTKEAGLALLAIVLSLVFHDMQYGPQAALIAESFGPNVRYSGAGLGYQLASVIAGGPAPLIAAAILTATKSSTFIRRTAGKHCCCSSGLAHPDACLGSVLHGQARPAWSGPAGRTCTGTGGRCGRSGPLTCRHVDARNPPTG